MARTHSFPVTGSIAAALAACLTATPAATAGPAAPIVPHYVEFRRWFLACDNVRRCEARGVDEDSSADLRIIRDAGPAPATITLSAKVLPDLRTLRLDEQPLPLADGWSAGKDGNLSTSDPAAVRAFIAQVRNGRRITFDADPVGVPLDGMIAALLRMDDVQGRTGTPSPLVARTGWNGVPGAPGLPVGPAWRAPYPLTAPEAAALAAAARAAHASLLGKHNCHKDADDQASALDDHLALVVLACAAYVRSSSSLVFTVPRSVGPATPLHLPLPTHGGPTYNELEDALFVPHDGTLHTVSSGGSWGNCGFSASWVWSNGAFRLTDMAGRTLCGGPAHGDWPTLFRTAPKP